VVADGDGFFQSGGAKAINGELLALHATIEVAGDAFFQSAGGAKAINDGGARSSRTEDAPTNDICHLNNLERNNILLIL
jgi:hypothetical protein